MFELLLLALAVALVLLFAIGGQASKKSKPPVRHRRTGHVDRDLVRQRWSTIKQMAKTGGGNGLRNAVSEADKLLDHVMKQRGWRGATMADRLKYGGNQFTDKNAIWRAHKLRNALMHEVEFDLVASQANEAIRDFEQGLKDLGAL